MRPVECESLGIPLIEQLLPNAFAITIIKANFTLAALIHLRFHTSFYMNLLRQQTLAVVTEVPHPMTAHTTFLLVPIEAIFILFILLFLISFWYIFFLKRFLRSFHTYLLSFYGVTITGNGTVQKSSYRQVMMLRCYSLFHFLFFFISIFHLSFIELI